MTSAELIKLLREIDPAGELDVRIHEQCNVTDAELFFTRMVTESKVTDKPYIILETDCYCGYVL